MFQCQFRQTLFEQLIYLDLKLNNKSFLFQYRITFFFFLLRVQAFISPDRGRAWGRPPSASSSAGWETGWRWSACWPGCTAPRTAPTSPVQPPSSSTSTAWCPSATFWTFAALKVSPGFRCSPWWAAWRPRSCSGGHAAASTACSTPSRRSCNRTRRWHPEGGSHLLLYLFTPQAVHLWWLKGVPIKFFYLD